MRVLFPVDEAYPLFKIGGLGDVGGSLPKALAAIGIDVRVALPKHPEITVDSSWKQITTFEITYNHHQLPITVFQGKLPPTEIPVYLFEEKTYLSEHTDASDNHADKFAVFSLVVATWISQYQDWQPEVIHFHDWHTALIPVICKHLLNKQDYSYVGTIHNLVYQGNTDTPVGSSLGLPEDACEILSYDKGDNHINILLEGLLHADMITAVSPTYAKEIMTPEYGAGVAEFMSLRKQVVRGVLNGLDLDVNNPETDQFLFAQFSKDTVGQGKDKNKRELLQQLLPTVDPTEPLIGFVGRVDPGQKGVQLIIEAIQQQALPSTGSNLVFLGTGAVDLEQALHQAVGENPRIKIITRYDEELAKRIYAASDLMIIPSKYEPCGLVQMIAMRYGALPIARKTGGLADTINHRQNGFLFEAYTTEAMMSSITEALAVWKDESKREQMITNAMNTDFSWDLSAPAYQQIYNEILTKPANNV